MSHLGDRVAPLIDGELPLDASERAMTHMASCPSCHEAADLERLTKQRLASLGSPLPGTDFTQRLLALGVSQGPAAPRPGGYLAGGSGSSTLTPTRTAPVSMPPFGSTSRPPGRRTMLAQARPPGGSPAQMRRLPRITRNRLAVAAAGAACLVGVGVAGTVAAAPAQQRGVTPPTTSLNSQFNGQTALVGVARGGR